MVSVCSGLAALKKYNYSEYADPAGVLYAVSALSSMPDQSREKRTLAALLNLIGVSKIRFSNYFVLKRPEPLLGFFNHVQILGLPTSKEEIDGILNRLAESIEATYLVQKSIAKSFTRVNVCLDSLPQGLAGQEIKNRILDKKSRLQAFLESGEPVNEINFCKIDRYDRETLVTSSALSMDISNP